MEDHVRSAGDKLAARILARNVEGVGIDLAGEAGWRLRRHDIDQRELVDRLAVEPARDGEPLGELAPDHAGRAGDENVHWCSSPELSSGRRLHRARSEG